jgi:hypothetical protein
MSIHWSHAFAVIVLTRMCMLYLSGTVMLYLSGTVLLPCKVRNRSQCSVCVLPLLITCVANFVLLLSSVVFVALWKIQLYNFLCVDIPRTSMTLMMLLLPVSSI